MFVKKGGPQATFFAVEIFENLTGSFAVNSAQDDVITLYLPSTIFFTIALVVRSSGSTICLLASPAG